MGLYILTYLIFMPIKEMHNDIYKLIDKFVDNCKPTQSETILLNNIAYKIKDQITNFVSNSDKNSFVTDVVFGGSFAKGTWLKNEADIDIFVKFDNQTILRILKNMEKK